MRPVPNMAAEFVGRAEGRRLTAYQDLGGVWTIGYGHTDPDVHGGLRVTLAQADAWLRQDLDIAARRIADRLKPQVLARLNDHQYAALLSFVFNLGADRRWTLWRVLNAGALDQAPAQMARFVFVDGRKSAGLARRRADEIALWHAGDAVAAPMPSSQARLAKVSPVPDAKPMLQSRSFLAAGAAGVAGVATAVGEVSRAVAPFEGQSPWAAKLLGALATCGAALALLALALRWLRHRRRGL